MITIRQNLKTVSETVSHRAYFLASILKGGFVSLANGNGGPISGTPLSRHFLSEARCWSKRGAYFLSARNIPIEDVQVSGP